MTSIAEFVLSRFVVRHKSAARGSLTETEEVKSLLPIVRNFCLIIGIYHGIVLLDRLYSERGIDLLILAGLAIATPIMCFAFYWGYLRGDVTRRRLDIASGTVNALLLISPIVYQCLHFNQQRLVYFVFLAMIFAATAPSMTVLVPSALLCIGALAWIANAFSPHVQPENAMMILVIVPTVAIVSNSVRHALLSAVRAKVHAEKMRGEAQVLADCDALTSLPNRRSFFQQMDIHLASAEADEPFDLALIDLDGFKPINDIYGHSVGDALLIEVAARLRETCGSDGFPARMGGDEFAIILPGRRSEIALQAFGNVLCEALRDPYVLGSVSAIISGSVGFVRCLSGGQTSSQLLERADYALYFAKQNLRGAPVIFNDKHETEMRDFSVVDQTLRSSDLDRELSIVFQPQIDVLENRTVSFEALARWDSARLGAVRPDIFIKAAERSGLITRITLLLLEKALVEVAKWPLDTRVSFNLSARDLRSGISISNISKAVHASGIDPHRIEFEITETAMLTDFEQACEALSKLKALGCRIAVDDFGSGYSSFSYIHRLPIDKIKIDRSFVVQLVKHGSALKIIKTIIDLCRNLNLDCVIEGVETEAEMAKLSQVKARYIQGYLFARPMAADDVMPYLVREGERTQARQEIRKTAC